MRKLQARFIILNTFQKEKAQYDLVCYMIITWTVFEMSICSVGYLTFWNYYN